MRISVGRSLIFILVMCLQSGPSVIAAAGSAGITNAYHLGILDANEISMCFSNNGLMAYNDTMPSGRRGGFIYPVDSAFSLMYSAWLWLAAEVDGSTRVALVESRSEFAPGPIDHEPVGDSSIFRVYKIRRTDTDSLSNDWSDWPACWGAPLTASGEPLVTGDQSIWTVFNDGDSLRHTRPGGGTAPLGAEVQLYAWACSNSGLLDQIVFLEYTIINNSPHDWIDFRAGILADPDLGEVSDDMGSTDSARSLVCCYSFEHDRLFPPRFSPAVGIVMLESPSSERGGAISGSANVLKNYYSSRNLQETINVLSGKDPSGTEYVDPTTGRPTRYPYGGDPRTGTGWLDFGKADRKIAIVSAPAQIRAGETAHLSVAFLAAWGKDNAEALVNLYRIAESACDFHRHGLSGLQVARNIRDGSIQSISFDPPEQMWFTGDDWGGSALEGGVGWAGELWGTSLRRSDNVDVELVFDPGGGQQAARLIENQGVFRFADCVTVPFTCRRTEDSVTLNVLFVDSDSDGKWAPRGLDSGSRPEIILIAHSAHASGQPSRYVNCLFPNDALDTDLMYAVSLKIKPRYERKNVRAGQRLSIRVTAQDDPMPVDTVDFGDVIIGHRKSLPLHLLHTYSGSKEYRIGIDNSENFALRTRNILFSEPDTGRIGVTFTPTDTTMANAILTIIASEYNRPVARILLMGSGRQWPIAGDIYTNGTLDIIDATCYMSYLYRDFIPPCTGVRLDLDGSGDVTLSDLVILITMIFHDD